jgi:glycerol uptake facilitator-like aquaporin
VTLRQRVLAELLGTAGLLVAVVGSGIMAESLAQGNAAVALLANSLATGAALYALIQSFGTVSGAHFNPAVSLVEWLWKRLSGRDLAFYALAQLAGAVGGVLLSHAMFGQALIQRSMKDRGELRLALSESVATFGLLTVIALSGRKSPASTPQAVALYITAAYWCTSSTSFANPAATLARSLTDTFSGIHGSGAPLFIAAQLLGAGLAYAATRALERG